MTITKTRLAAALIPLVAALVLVTPETASARVAGTLSISRDSAVPGEILTFSGRIPGIGKRKLVLQRNLGRWLDVKTFRAKAGGAFETTAPASGMESNLYRVAVKGTAKATPTRSVKSIQQDVVIEYDEDEPEPGQQVVAEVISTPAFPGRSLTLQLRNPDLSWTTVAEAAADGAGRAEFAVTAPTSGSVVYRAVAGQVDGVAWYPSFPNYLTATPTSGGTK